jgi:putative addiction module killer protein
MTLRILEYQTETGAQPFRAWFDRLNATHAAKVSVALLRLSQGNTSDIKWFAGLGELRINWGPGLRIYLTQDDGSWIILLGGGNKASQVRDIEHAKRHLAQYRRRKRGKSNQ